MRNDVDDRARIEEFLESALNETVWAAITGSRGDYVLSLQLGARERRSARLANPRLNFLQRTYEGSIGFLIECPWRLDGPQGVLLSYVSALELENSEAVGDVPEFVDLTLESFTLEGSPWDLDLYFSGGHRLRCFCAEIATGDDNTWRAQALSSRETRRKFRRIVRNNWSFWSPVGSLVVGPSGRVLQNEEPPVEALRRRLREIMDVDDPDGE